MIMIKTLIIIALIFFVSITAHADNELVQTHAPVKLERVIDGDTIVASGRTIRLWGIDTPEKDEPFFLAAKFFLETLLDEGELRCKFIEKDRYQRSVMHCTVEGRDIGSLMVQMGMAKDYSRYSGDYYQYEEDLAKKEKRGIWK